MAVSQPATGSTVMARLGLQLRKGTEHRSFRLAAGELPKPVLFLGDAVFPIDRSDSVPALPTAIDCGRGRCVDPYLGFVLANWQSSVSEVVELNKEKTSGVGGRDVFD